MRIRRVLVIANPASRSAARQEQVVVRAFESLGVEVQVRHTEAPGDAARLAATCAREADAVFTLGGDGTAMEVLPVAGAAGVPVGILPGGTGNQIVRALAIPLDVRRAVRALVEGGERPIDLGELSNGRHFAYVAGIGVDVRMLEGASRGSKQALGVAAYVGPAIGAVLARETFTLRATVDGVPHTFRASAAFIANFGTVLGGVVTLGPEIEPNDGWLDLCVFAPSSMAEAVGMGWRMLRRDFSGASGMHFLKGKVIELETEPARRTQADGELLGMTPITARVRPLAVRVLVPA